MLVTQESVFRFGDVEVREREFRLIKAGEVIPVEPKAFRVLLFLLHNPQKLIAKEELLNAVWGDTAVSENSLTRSIALLRRLLGEDTHQPHFIETVSTVGYRFVCPVQTEQPPDTSSNKSPHVAVVAPIATVTQGVNGKSSSGEIAAVFSTATAEHPGTSAPVASITPPRVHPRWHWPWVAAVAMLAVAGIAVGWWEWWSNPAVPYVTGIEAITHDGLDKGLAVTDGSRVFL